MHHYQDLITIFNQCFATTYNTLLKKGGDEPVYIPSGPHSSYNILYFAHGYFSSALHECAHWLIAGEARRKLEDFGYWYTPDGRNEVEQKKFQEVEIKPQALEWILSVATGYRFQVSLDNLSGGQIDREPFIQRVYREVKTFCERGLSPRAAMFRQALCQFYNTNQALSLDNFIYK